MLADLDSLDASAGLDAAGAKAIRDLLEIGHVRGQALPAPVEVGSVRFRVAPADEFGPAMAYMVTDGTETLLDATVPVPHRTCSPTSWTCTATWAPTPWCAWTHSQPVRDSPRRSAACGRSVAPPSPDRADG